jgi:hypothetical protein
MLDQAKDKEKQKNAKINELTKALAEETERGEKMTKLLQQIEAEKEGNEVL